MPPNPETPDGLSGPGVCGSALPDASDAWASCGPLNPGLALPDSLFVGLALVGGALPPGLADRFVAGARLLPRVGREPPGDDEPADVFRHNPINW